MTTRDSNLNLKCDHIVPTVNDHFYHFPDEMPAGFLCDNCAKELGFCPVCGYFVLGSSDDRTLYSHGCCSECLEDFKIELGEYDDDDGDDFNYG